MIANNQWNVCKAWLISNKKMTWNLSGLLIISFSVNQPIVMSLSDSNVLINMKPISPEAHSVLSSVKLWIEAIKIKKKNY